MLEAGLQGQGHCSASPPPPQPLLSRCHSDRIGPPRRLHFTLTASFFFTTDVIFMLVSFFQQKGTKQSLKGIVNRRKSTSSIFGHSSDSCMQPPSGALRLCPHRAWVEGAPPRLKAPIPAPGVQAVGLGPEAWAGEPGLPGHRTGSKSKINEATKCCMVTARALQTGPLTPQGQVSWAYTGCEGQGPGRSRAGSGALNTKAPRWGHAGGSKSSKRADVMKQKKERRERG